MTLPSSRSRTVADLVIVNPLAGALQHYTSQLERMLNASGVSTHVISVAEPSLSGKGRVRWLRNYFSALRATRRHRRRGGRLIVTWPVLGHLDRILVPIVSADRRSVIVMHDPRPLVRAVGYGRIIIALANLLSPKNSLVVHSELAAEHLRLRDDRLVLLPHPLLSGGARPTRPSTPVVRVLGQWKPDRDLELLAALADRLGDVRMEIVGRGWPAVAGWSVRDEFVPEGELDDLIRTSSVVLIPYRRYYQSGIAARAVEMAVPVVGTADELGAMTGRGYPFLVPNAADVSEWVEASLAALTSSSSLLQRVSVDASSNASVPWEQWARS